MNEPGRTPEGSVRAAAGRRTEPLIAAGFRVEIEGLAEAAAVEVVLPDARIVAERGDRTVQYGPLTLRRALTRSQDWYQWWHRARHPEGAEVARTVRVILVDRTRMDVAAWTFAKAQPIAYSLSPLNALANAPVVETLEVSVSGFEAVYDASTGDPPAAGPQPSTVGNRHA